MKVHFIQSGFRDQGGHYLLETRSWYEAVSQAGLSWQGFAHRNLDAALARTAHVIPLFPFEPSDQIDPDPISRDITDLLYLSEQFSSAASLIQDVDGGDLVIVEFATEREIYGVARWLRQLPAAVRPHVAFLVHLPGRHWTVDATRTRFNAEIGAWRFAINQLKVSLPAQKIHVAAIDPRLAELLATALDLPVSVTPLVSWFDEGLVNDPPIKRYDFLFAGSRRIDKGADLVMSVIDALAAERFPMRIAMQVGSQQEAAAVRQALPAMPDFVVDVAVGPLDTDQYIERLISSRIVVLPYVAASYAMRGSGIAGEAFGYGLPVVVPQGTWMSDRLAEQWGAGATFSEHTPLNICKACVAALDQAHILEPAARAHAPRWRAEQSASIALQRLRNYFGV